jgi:hypothetical protein
MVGGPPRVVHHITWDKLNPDGTPGITFDNVASYLISVGYEPHLLIDPVTGRVKQFVPFDRSAYALANKPGGVQTNRYGQACIQVEWYFTPGVVRDGKRYESLTDTPLAGLDVVLQVADSWGIPRTWAGGERDVDVWLNTAGHRGHVDVPENDHTDPCQIDVARLVPATAGEGDDMPLSDEDLQKIQDMVDERLRYAIGALEGKPNTVFRQAPVADLLKMEATLEALAEKLGVKL